MVELELELRTSREEAHAYYLDKMSGFLFYSLFPAKQKLEHVFITYSSHFRNTYKHHRTADFLVCYIQIGDRSAT